MSQGEHGPWCRACKQARWVPIGGQLCARDEDECVYACVHVKVARVMV